MTETDIEYNLLSYVDRLEKDIQVGNFRTTKTEDFFLRLFKSVYRYFSKTKRMGGGRKFRKEIHERRNYYFIF